METQHVCRGIVLCPESHLETVLIPHQVDSASLFQGVIEFSLCLLFAKLVSYTFLFWLPLYITNVGECLPEWRFSSVHRLLRTPLFLLGQRLVTETTHMVTGEGQHGSADERVWRHTQFVALVVIFTGLIWYIQTTLRFSEAACV